MSGLEPFLKTAADNHNKMGEVLTQLTAVAHHNAVFGPATTVGEYTLITAAEVTTGLGFGYGVGGGDDGAEKTTETERTAAGGGTAAGGAGGGGGGGGGSLSRPVAAISIGPDGVRVEPIVDVTKIAVTFLTAIGAIVLAGIRANK